MINRSSLHRAVAKILLLPPCVDFTFAFLRRVSFTKGKETERKKERNEKRSATGLG